MGIVTLVYSSHDRVAHFKNHPVKALAYDGGFYYKSNVTK